jgi:hypothetical protein
MLSSLVKKRKQKKKLGVPTNKSTTDSIMDARKATQTVRPNPQHLLLPRRSLATIMILLVGLLLLLPLRP